MLGGLVALGGPDFGQLRVDDPVFRRPALTVLGQQNLVFGIVSQGLGSTGTV